MLKILLSCAVLAASLPAYAASSGQVIELQSATRKLEVIGTVPPKRHIDLDLGELRTREAVLPGGNLTRADRMRLRSERALARQKAVTNARRKAAERKSDSDAVPVTPAKAGEPPSATNISIE